MAAGSFGADSVRRKEVRRQLRTAGCLGVGAERTERRLEARRGDDRRALAVAAPRPTAAPDRERAADRRSSRKPVGPRSAVVLAALPVPRPDGGADRAAGATAAAIAEAPTVNVLPVAKPPAQPTDVAALPPGAAAAAAISPSAVPTAKPDPQGSGAPGSEPRRPDTPAGAAAAPAAPAAPAPQSWAAIVPAAPPAKAAAPAPADAPEASPATRPQTAAAAKPTEPAATAPDATRPEATSPSPAEVSGTVVAALAPDLTEPDRPAAPAATTPKPVAGSYRTVCVRTCDGFYFPISWSVTAGEVERDGPACARLCPGSPTELFSYRSDEDVDAARGSSGRLYKDLPTAYAFRSKQDPACTCATGGVAVAPRLPEPLPDLPRTPATTVAAPLDGVQGPDKPVEDWQIPDADSSTVPAPSEPAPEAGAKP